MVAKNDKVIIKRKSWDEVTHQDDVHIAESLILSGFLDNVHYMMAGCSK